MGKPLVHSTDEAGACQSKSSRPHFKLGHYHCVNCREALTVAPYCRRGTLLFLQPFERGWGQTL